MAATVQLNIQTNADEVTGKIKTIQTTLDAITNKPYKINIESNVDKVSRSVIQYVNAQAKLELAHAKVLQAEAKLAQTQAKLSIEQEKTTQSANRLAAAEEKTAQTENRLATEQEKSARAASKAGDAQKEYTEKTKNTITQSNILIGVLRSLGHILVHEVRAAFNSALTEMKNVDTELITIQKVTGESAEAMKRYADDAYEVAARLGAGASEYLNAVAEFAKAGYGETSKELGELAIMTAKVGDTTQSVANQFLLSVDAAYRYEGSIEKLTAVLDGANEIGNRYATSVEKMAEGLGKVSPIAAQAHVGIDELTAAIGTITAVTQRSGQEAATALRALVLNIIGDTKTEIEDGAKWTAGEIEGLRDLLNKYAADVVKAADATGKVINPMEAIRALYQAMQDGVLTEQKLMEQVSDIGGKLRSSQLLALIQNFDKYENMLKTYREAAGSAAEEYAIYLNSWEAKTKQLSATWTDFVQRQLGTDEIKNLLDFLIKIVGNLDNITPLLKSIAAAILVINVPVLVTYIERLVIALTSVNGVIGLVIVALGALISKEKAYEQSLKDAAKASLDEAENAAKTASSWMELGLQYISAKSGSEEFQSASEQMQQKLKDEGVAVENLTEQYREYARQAYVAAQAAATEAQMAAATSLETFAQSPDWLGKRSVSFNTGNMAEGSLYSRIDEIFASSAYTSKKQTGSFAGRTAYSYLPSAMDADSVLGYYETVVTAVGVMNKEYQSLLQKGDKDAATALRDSDLYKDLIEAESAYKETAEAYKSANQAYNNANDALSNYDNFNNWIDFLKGGERSKSEIEWFYQALRASNTLTDEQKTSLLNMARNIYPEFADSLKGVAEAADETTESIQAATSALEDFQNATKKGLEKDDPFKDYKGVFDAVMKEGKAGRYGSNAFQYGIKALLDPSILKQFGNDWKGIYNYIKGNMTSLYKDANSMGAGFLNMIKENGEQAAKGVYEVKDATVGLLASFNTKTGEWFINDSPEGLAALAKNFGMSAESIVAFAQALGAVDPSVNTDELVKSLQTLNEEAAGLEGKEPDITVTTNADEVIPEIQSIGAEADAVAGTRTITYDIKVNGSPPNLADVPGMASGAEDFKGGPVLVNDQPGGYNPELIVANGRAFIANGGNPAILNLPRGAVIYNADETRSILGGGANLMDIPSYASGVFNPPGGSGGGGGGGGSGGSSGGSGSSKKSKKKHYSDDELLKKLSEYMEEILGMAEDALNDQLEAINAQIYALKYQTEAAEKASALEEARLNLLQAEQNLIDANTERTVRYYNAATGQWEWMADQQKVLQAQEELAEAQKDLLKAQYDALEAAWEQLRDEIEKALEDGDEEIDIDALLEALAGSDAGGSADAIAELIRQILGFTENPSGDGSFDSGGIAHGLGWMPKGTAGAEAVLDPSLTSAILNPVTNAAFTGFTDSLTSLFQLAGGGGALPSSRFAGNVSNLYGGNTYIEGVRIGSDMMSRPLSEVLATLNLYKNN